MDFTLCAQYVLGVAASTVWSKIIVLLPPHVISGRWGGGGALAKVNDRCGIPTKGLEARNKQANRRLPYNAELLMFGLV